MVIKQWSIKSDELQTKYQQQNRCLSQLLPENLGAGQSNIFRLDTDLDYIETFYTPARNLASYHP